jgi:hypothetical protein
MSHERKGAAGDRITKRRSQRRGQRKPPWGNLLGKPIERQFWSFDRKIARKEDDLARAQFQKMVALKHYGIYGGDHPAPVLGVAPADWVPWYQLSLRLASDLDPSLTIIDAPPPSKTTPQWRGGADGQVLLTLVETFKEMRPNRSIRWCLKAIQKYNANLQQYSLDELNRRYHEAKRHFGSAKRTRKASTASH